jgi:hypothetical protein
MCLFDWSDLRGLGHRWAEAETPTTRRKQFFRSPAVRSLDPRYLWLQYKVSIMFGNHPTPTLSFLSLFSKYVIRVGSSCVRSIFYTKVMYDREECQTQCPRLIFWVVKVPIFLYLRSCIKYQQRSLWPLQALMPCMISTIFHIRHLSL